jgi:hypothetical protein
MHEFNARYGALRRLEGFASEHRPDHPLDGSTVLLHDIIQVFDLADDDGRTARQGLHLVTDWGYVDR